MTKYNDTIRFEDNNLNSYREGVDAVLSRLDGEAAYQIRLLIDEGVI